MLAVRPRPRPLAPLAALGVLVLTVLGLLAGASPAQAAPADLPPSRERIVLRLIDDACGDTWCEGDHAFAFRRLTCSVRQDRCRLRLRLAPYADGPLQWVGRTGTLPYRTYAQMVVTSPDGRSSLDPAFYADLSELVGRLEATVPVRPAP